MTFSRLTGSMVLGFSLSEGLDKRPADLEGTVVFRPPDPTLPDPCELELELFLLSV